MKTTNAQWHSRRSDLLRYLARRVGDSALREDIVQEALAKFFVYQARPGTGIDNVPGLLRRISLDLARDHFRRMGRVQHVAVPEDLACPQTGIHELLEQRRIIGMIVDIMKAMPELRRDVFFRRRFEGRSSKEVARMFGISPGAVDAHVAREVMDLLLAIEKLEKRGAIVAG